MKGIAKLALALGGLMLFMLALEVMKQGAGGIAQFMRARLQVTNAANSMGFGWLMAYAVMSGSPVAAAAVALLSAGALSVLQAFTMVAGSRMGASSVVLLVGFIYVIVRRQERATALAPGVISFLVTASMQVLAVPLGIVILTQGWFNVVSFPALSVVAGGLGQVTDPVVGLLSAHVPDLLLFAGGVGLTTLSLRLFDRALPELHLERTDLGQVPRLVYRPEIMFLMGVVITLLTLSVSVSVSMLIPLSTRGYIRRENIVPYILGANVSTFVDTLVAAALLGDPRAVTIVLTHMVCATAVAVLLVLLAIRSYERLLSRMLSFVTRQRRHLVGFLAVIVVIPVLLLMV
jgi:sodium-dependent phosphate cotransporter